MKQIYLLTVLLTISHIQAQLNAWVSYADADSAVVMISNEVEFGGFQLLLDFENTLDIQLQDIEPGEAIENFMLSWNPQGGGSIVIIGFSLNGENIPVGEHHLMTFRYSYLGGNGWMYIDSEEAFYFSECLQIDYMIGDVNEDLIFDVLDLVVIVNHILGLHEFSQSQICSADMNQDGIIDITDLVTLVNYFLDNESL